MPTSVFELYFCFKSSQGPLGKASSLPTGSLQKQHLKWLMIPFPGTKDNCKYCYCWIIVVFLVWCLLLLAESFNFCAFHLRVDLVRASVRAVCTEQFLLSVYINNCFYFCVYLFTCVSWCVSVFIIDRPLNKILYSLNYGGFKAQVEQLNVGVRRRLFGNWEISLMNWRCRTAKSGAAWEWRHLWGLGAAS